MDRTEAVKMTDDLDRRIIAALQQDARASVSAIAARIGVARTTVHERIARLEDKGIIAGYSVVLRENPDAPSVQVLIMLEVQQRETGKIVNRLKGFPEVRLCLSINGDYDLFVNAEAPRIEDLDLVVDEIGRIPGVVRTNTFVVFGRRIDRG
jgi:DNA-binding Lrp family transcriptional regulator